ncbi:MAG: hypothetical protein HC769_34415 [Cyanobacteria bacterium CRU_2_1]|nr:hypothetical protein [Cyanobacteria bacterium RU_5_0]NJR63429.1 hypothetical protein [Cyanobacteria bacterium CRU_2_1]
MNYQEQLSPWVVYRLLSNLQRQALDRFRRRNDAEAYLKTIQRLQPNDRFAIVYEGMSNTQESHIFPCLTD